MILNVVLLGLALLSFALLLWQWLVARRFPLHRRVPAHSFPPAVTLLKPLKGCDPDTEDCLRSWFAQEYTGRVQILFGVGSADDPVCPIVSKLQAEFPQADAQLVAGIQPAGTNAKVSTLRELERLAKHELLIISDADVRVPSDLLANLIEPLRTGHEPAAPVKGEPGLGVVNPVSERAAQHPTPPKSATNEVALVTCFYRLANPTTRAMQWEAVAINADFWSQVLQSRSLGRLQFALGAVMLTRRKRLEEIGGFTALLDCLADDYQLGYRLARRGYRIALSSVVVECWSAPMSWAAVWKHQLRWARTIRVCQPLPYFFSILSNCTFWPLLWLLLRPSPAALGLCGAFWLGRMWFARDLQKRLNQGSPTAGDSKLAPAWMPLVKDLLQALIWLLAFAGNTIEWRGQRLHLRRDGTLVQPK